MPVSGIALRSFVHARGGALTALSALTACVSLSTGCSLFSGRDSKRAEVTPEGTRRSPPGNEKRPGVSEAPSTTPPPDKNSVAESADEWDARLAYIRTLSDTCGRTPDSTALAAFDALSAESRRAAVIDALRGCVQSDHWQGKDGVVWQLAHAKVAPFKVAKSGEDAGANAILDYYDDYNLFVYFNTGDRDVRGILTSDQFVLRESNPTRYLPVDSVPLRPDAGFGLRIFSRLARVDGQQFVERSKRAGMLTTLYNLTIRTTSTPLPRQTASHVLRTFFDMDLAKGEGLDELAPKDPSFKLQDFDSKGITAPACATCHVSLDPVAYVFSRYEGFGNATGGGPADPRLLLAPGLYNPRRIEVWSMLRGSIEPRLGEIPESGYVFGEPALDLVDWAKKAANTPYFARAVVRSYWKYFMRADVSQDETEQFNALVERFMGEGKYRVEALVEDIIKTSPYARVRAGVPLSGVKRKRPEHLQADFARALALPADALCKERGRPCLEAYGLALGGVEAYSARVFAPLDPTFASALALDRYVLAACGERVSRDLAGEPVLFRDLQSEQGRESSLARLYDAFLARKPTAAEVALHGAPSQAGDASRLWALNACYVVATGDEALFY